MLLREEQMMSMAIEAEVIMVDKKDMTFPAPGSQALYL